MNDEGLMAVTAGFDSDIVSFESNSISSAETRHISTVNLEGEIGQPEAKELCDLLLHMASKGVFSVVIDFSEVSHLDYRGVRPLVRRALAFRELGGDVKLAGLSPYIHAIVRSAGANDEFDVFAEIDQARWAFLRPNHRAP